MDEAYKNKLWNEYAATKSSEVREQLILEYAPLVKLVAGPFKYVSWLQCGI